MFEKSLKKCKKIECEKRKKVKVCNSMSKCSMDKSGKYEKV